MSPQQTIAHYRIISKLGEGGMGTVFRAADTKLGREVAIKILPDAFANDPDRLARFTREAQVLASLNHPNIAAIYGVEDRALIMELVEGETLHGPIPEEQALPIVQQLIDALEYAHEKGIIHRDLKPANIKVTPEARVKVLDFGLAKALTQETAAANPAVSPTLTMRATAAGVIMGTAAYMAPEQARGQDVDKRADIWSFGVVVYELLTGNVLFDGPTVSDTLASVLRHTVDFEAIPARFRRLVRVCLERDHRRRMRDIGDARLLLEEPAAAPALGAPAPPGKQTGAIWKIAAAVATLAALILAAMLLRPAAPADRPLMRFNAEMAPDAIGATPMTLAISPDGRRVAFRMRTPNGYMLATKLLDQAQPALLAGTEGVNYAFFSPDSQWIGFHAGDKLKKVAVQGGAPSTLCDAPLMYGAAWLEDGTIVGVMTEWVLFRVPDSGGTPQRFLRQELMIRWPQALPGAGNILITSAPFGTLDFDSANIEVFTLQTGKRKTVVRGGYAGRYLPTGHLVYVRGGTLYGVRFDASGLEARGNAVPLLEDVASAPSQGAGRFDISQTGTFVYTSGKPAAAAQPLALVDSAGAQTPLPGAAGTSVRISPDGKRLAYSASGDLYVYDLSSQTATRITFDPQAGNRHPTWTPDGKYLAYAAAGGIWWTRSDGSGQPRRILEGTPPPTPWSIVADPGRRLLRLAFHQSRGTESLLRDVWILPLDVTDPEHTVPGKPEPLLTAHGNSTAPALSPDGRWLAYLSQSENSTAIMVQRYQPGVPASGGQWQIPSEGLVNFPVWSGSGNQLFFRAGTERIMVVDYTVSGDTFVPGRPREWSPIATYVTSVFQNFDMFADGKHAVIVALADQYKGGTVGLHATFLLNFFDELKRRLP